MSAIALILLLVVGFAGAMFWPAIYATLFRQTFRAWPDARDAFVGRGSWISFSRRFGWPYAIGALALAVVLAELREMNKAREVASTHVLLSAGSVAEGRPRGYLVESLSGGGRHRQALS